MTYKNLLGEIIVIIGLISVRLRLIYVLFEIQLYLRVKRVHIQYFRTIWLILRKHSIALILVFI